MNPDEFCQSISDCKSQYMFQKEIEKKLSAPMPWIGMYVAAASLVCFLAMAADAFHGFRSKRLWFPCKYFTLNAASLTLLAVAMKMPLNLSTSDPKGMDRLAKLSSTVLMTTILGNFMPSIGSMDNKEIFMNITALGIFVITVVVNMCIQLGTTSSLYVQWVNFSVVVQYVLMVEHSVVMFCMLVLFVISIFSALIVPTTKKYIELKYNETHQIASGNKSDENGFSFEKLTEDLKKYLVMAETGSPQFVMARSATCCASGGICFLIALLLAQAEVRIFWELNTEDFNVVWESDYKWSTFFTFVFQTAAVGVGIIAPTFRWFTAIILKCSKKRGESYKTNFKIENYWIERLVEWKESPIGLRIRHSKFRKVVHVTKNLGLEFCIKLQILIVFTSKLFCFISIFLATPFYSCYHCCKRLIAKHISKSSAPKDKVSETETKLELGRYVLLLEGEGEMSERVLKNISNAADQLIQMGKNQKPKFLMELLEKYTAFTGLVDFDNDYVPSVNSPEPPNCWALPVVTLTSIAIAISKNNNHIVDRLVRGVSEGLLYVSIIESVVDAKGDLMNIRNAADRVWLRVELYNKWLDEDLHEMALKGTSSREILERLADIAKKNVIEVKGHKNGSLEENPLNWPIKVLAANSMYRISQTIMLDHESNNDQVDEKLFEKLSTMIAGILGACFTNLPCIITKKFFSSAIETREKSVQRVARLIGETEAILKFLQQHEFPCKNTDHVANIDEWRTIIGQTNNLAIISTSNNDSTASAAFASVVADVFDPFSPTTSLKEDDKALYLRREMPGLDKDHVQVHMEHNTLVIKGKGEKESEEDEYVPRYSSRIELPSKMYKVDEIKVEMKNGVLKVVVPKVKEEESKHVVQVKVE